MAGAPTGNTNGAKGKIWRDALRKALARYENKELKIKRGQALEGIAMNVVRQAIESGCRDAYQEIANRLDGKPHQSMDISAEVGVVQTVINAQPELETSEWQKKHGLSGDRSPDLKPH